jgi:geranylgeranyl transferase type-2 subunit beta
MKRLVNTVACAYLTLLVVGSTGVAAAGGKTNPAIDLERTRQLIQGWGERQSFPESVSFAYYHAYSMRAFGQTLTPEKRQRIAGYVVRCQRPSGGFAAEPTHAQTANVIFTYYALNALQLSGGLTGIDRESAIRFLRARIQDGGGMTATVRNGDKPTLATTYYGVESLSLLGTIDQLDKQKTATFIRRYRAQDGGFAMVEGGGSNPEATDMAVRCLERLGALPPEVKAEVIAYLKATRYSGRITDKKYRGLPEIKAMAATLDALSILGAMQEINADKVYEFVASLYIPANGGFGPRPGLGTTPPSTFHAITCLVRLGKLQDPLAEGTARQTPPLKADARATPP